MLADKVTVISVNFRTPDLIRDCIVTFRRFYPDLPYIVIDNAGCARSVKVIRNLSKEHSLQTMFNDHNKGHGPALHQGIKMAGTRYAFLLDSDTKTFKGGFLERMLSEFAKDPKLFAMGWLRYVNAVGVAGPKQHLRRGMPYIHPYACLLDINKYNHLHPFIHSGAPATRLMHSVKKKKLHLKSFPVENYIWHKVAGTRGCFGGMCKVPTNMRKTKWRKHRI